MNTTQALRQAREVLDSLGVEYRLVLDTRPTRRLGQTRYSKREIGLSAGFVRLNEWSVIDQTVRHEAAHALVGPGHGHDAAWRLTARRCGVRRPASTSQAPGLVVVPGKYDVVCPRHGVIGARSRLPKRTARYAHIACGEPVRFELRRS